jgi:hypothetical protein
VTFHYHDRDDAGHTFASPKSAAVNMLVFYAILSDAFARNSMRLLSSEDSAEITGAAEPVRRIVS